jgi:hypothetical protein
MPSNWASSGVVQPGPQISSFCQAPRDGQVVYRGLWGRHGRGQLHQGRQGVTAVWSMLSMTDLTSMSTIGGLCTHGSFQCLHPTQILDQNKQM